SSSNMHESLIQEIRSKADIVQIIQNYLPLIKKGKNFVGVCPFHDDHDPSMSVSQDKQIFKCFVCGAGGNVFNFVKDFEQIPFPQAILKVAHLANIVVEDQYIERQNVSDAKHKHLYEVLAEYVRYAHYILNTTDGQGARDYLMKRGLDETIIDKFELGFNLDQDQATRFLLAKGHSLENCVKANLTRTNEYGNKDVFAKRIVFPIHSPEGRPIAFTARTLDPNESSKYINSTETELYVKGQVLYNYHRALRAIKQKKEMIVVEGVMDVIALDRVGVENVVATLGTACTKEQIRLMQSASHNVTICYDSDEAGQSASLRLARLLLAARMNVQIIRNNTGLDLDEIIEKQSKTSLQTLMEQKLSYLDFFFEYSLRRLDLANFNQRKEFAKLIMHESNQLKDRFDQALMVDRLAQATQFTPDQLRLLVQAQTSTMSQVAQRPLLKNKLELTTWAEKEILGQMLFSQQAVLDFRQELGFFADASYQKLALTIINYYRSHEECVIADFISTLEDASMIELVTQIVDSEI
ncbi:MAG: DNA primase, partial [Bacilli bacterium]|nr:DNA primase [Bacilli bacterium]